MKRILCLFFLCLLFTACGKSDGGQTTELPATLRITAELPDTYPSKVKLYNVENLEMDAEVVAETLLSKAADTVEERAQGRTWIVEIEDGADEILTCNGKSIVYSRLGDTPEEIEMTSLIGNHLLVTKTPDEMQQLYLMDAMKPCVETLELSFAPQKKVEQEIEEKLEQCGISGFALQSVYPMNAETLNYNWGIYQKACKTLMNNPYEVESYIEKSGNPEEPFTKDDEEYFLQYRKLVDGIPVSNDSLETLTKEFLPIIWMQFRYSAREGLRRFEANDLSVGDPISQKTILTPQEALNRYVENYRKAIHFDQTDIYEIELNYVTVKDSEGSYIRPAWMLRMDITLNGTDKEWVVNPETGKQEQTDKPLNLNEVTGELMHEYQTVAIDAVSGGILNEMEVPR